MPIKRAGKLKTITRHLYLEDLLKLFKYEELIRQSIAQQKDVSHWLMKNYFKLLDASLEQPLTKQEQKVRNKSIDSKKELLIAFFKDREAYHFEIFKVVDFEHGSLPEHQKPLEYSLKHFIEVLFLFFKEDMVYPVTEDKTSLIEYVHENLVSYLGRFKSKPAFRLCDKGYNRCGSNVVRIPSNRTGAPKQPR